jgi:hypothetical protein
MAPYRSALYSTKNHITQHPPHQVRKGTAELTPADMDNIAWANARLEIKCTHLMAAVSITASKVMQL